MRCARSGLQHQLRLADGAQEGGLTALVRPGDHDQLRAVGGHVVPGDRAVQGKREAGVVQSAGLQPFAADLCGHRLADRVAPGDEPLAEAIRKPRSVLTAMGGLR